MVLAHVGHWAVGLLYAAPVLVIVVALLVQRRRERGAADESAAPGEAEEWTPTGSSGPRTSSSG